MAAQLDSVTKNALRRDFWVWVGTSKSFCYEITTILVLLWVLTGIFAFSGLFEFAYWFKDFKAKRGYKKDVV